MMAMIRKMPGQKQMKTPNFIMTIRPKCNRKFKFRTIMTTRTIKVTNIKARISSNNNMKEESLNSNGEELQYNWLVYQKRIKIRKIILTDCGYYEHTYNCKDFYAQIL